MENHEGMSMPEKTVKERPTANKHDETVSMKNSIHKGNDMTDMSVSSAAEQKQMIISSHEKIIWTHLTQRFAPL